MGTVASLVIHWYELSHVKRDKSDSFDIFEPREICEGMNTRRQVDIENPL